MEESDRHRNNGDAARGSNGPDGGERADGQPENGPTEEVPVGEAGGDGTGAGVTEPEEFRRRLGVKDRHVRELYDELAAARLIADEAVAKAEAGELRVRNLEEERARLKERLHAFEEEERGRRRRREEQDRRVARLEREIERREDEIQRLKDLLEGKEEEIDEHGREAQRLLSRKNAALDNALERIEGLQRDLEEREEEVAELRSTIDDLRAGLDLEHERQRRAVEPANRLRAGINLFNESEHLQSIVSISKTLGQPEVHVALGEGDESTVVLTFTWGDVIRRTYTTIPGFDVEEPYVHQMGDESLFGGDREPSNAHLSPDGRVLLGL